MRCCGAASRTARSPKLMDGDAAALADGALEPLLVVVLLDVATLPPPRSTALPALLVAPAPLDRSTAAPLDASPLSGRCANAGVTSVTLAITIPSPRLKDFICAPLRFPRGKTWLYASLLCNTSATCGTPEIGLFSGLSRQTRPAGAAGPAPLID